jgi:glycosyltransferase involved in cell wall biosynthesis
MIERVGVVIPVHNEEELLGACLYAVTVATQSVDVPVHVVVALDRCTDRSRLIALNTPGVHIVQVDAGNVGYARAAGTEAVLRWAGTARRDTLWLATTDGDSVVPADWLRRQLAFAAAGWEVVVGTVAVSDWDEHPEHVRPRWEASYEPVDHHPHVHGANFGCVAACYLDAGGWLPLAADEDVALLAALRDHRILRTAAIPVITSARRDPRAAGGFGDTLRQLAG